MERMEKRSFRRSESSPLLFRSDSVSSFDVWRSDPRYSKYRLCYSWYALILLLIADISYQVNRLIIAFVKTDMQEDIEFDESQYGLLIGYGMVIFVLIGIPAGILADRYSRKLFILCGVILWSAMMFAQGVSQKYYQLLLCRIGLAISEASFNPPTLALISDYFPKEKRVIPTSTFHLGFYLASGLASFLSIIASKEYIGWRWTFHYLGFAGLGIAIILLFTLTERKRENRKVENIQYSRKTEEYGYRQAFLYVMSLSSAWKIFLASGIRTFGTFVILGFLPEFIFKTFPDYETQAYYVYGFATILGGSSSLISGVITKLFQKRSQKAPSLVVGISLLIACPAFGLAIFSRSIYQDEKSAFVLCGVGLFLGLLFGEMWAGPTAFMVQSILPTPFQASGFASYFCIRSLIGGAGPEVVGLLIEKIGGYEELILGLSIIGSYFLSSIIFLLSGSAFTDDLVTKEVFDMGGHHPPVSLLRKQVYGFCLLLLLCITITLIFVTAFL